MTALTVATWNIGNGDLADAAAIMDTAAVMVTQESSDRGALYANLAGIGGHATRCGVVRPTSKPGEAAIGQVYRLDRLKVARFRTILAAASQYVGRGTGPDRMKAKWLLIVVYRIKGTRRMVRVVTTHNPAGQRGRNTREQVAARIITRAAKVGSRSRIPTVLGLDANTNPDGPAVKPLRAAGWQCSHDVHRLPTHGANWSPDQIWWRSRHGVEFGGQHTMPTRSDHRALLATLRFN